MGMKPKREEINFNYPIPRPLHQKVRMMAAETDIAVKDIVVYALTEYTSKYFQTKQNPVEEEDDL